MPTLEQIHDYYVDMTARYSTYGDGTQGWHMGLWEPGIATQAEALLASNRRLLAGLPIDAQTHILDAGCGVGGLAIWAARTLGCRVTGITIVPMHVAHARMWAALAGVIHLCQFECMNMNDLAFADETFDVVTNQESACYAPDKRHYLQQVHRVLRPGGSWRSMDWTVRDKPLPPRGERWHRELCAGWHMYPFHSRREIEAMIGEAGYRPEVTEDLTDLAIPHIRPWLSLPRGRIPAAARRTLTQDPRAVANFRGHLSGMRAFAYGLVHRYLEHCLFGATKPDASPS
jgi:cyclopropane fatty-acyl-phospholipid synthase-like methyltransferase